MYTGHQTTIRCLLSLIILWRSLVNVHMYKKVNDLRPFVDYEYGPATGMGTGVASAILSDRLKSKQNGSICSARQFRT